MLLVFGGSMCVAAGGLMAAEAVSKYRLSQTVAAGAYTTVEEAVRLADERSRRVVMLHGAVACDEPLRCEMAKGAPGAAVVLRSSVGHWFPRSWDEQPYPIESMRRTTRYSLAGRVHPRGFVEELEDVHVHTERSGSPAVVSFFAGLLQLPMLGFEVEHRESVLPVGVDALAVGVVCRTREGDLAIRPPGGPFSAGLLTTRDEQDVVRRLREEAAVSGLTGAGLAVLGGALIAGAAVR